ncbi:MAG TPA: hypothetical protein VMU41_14645 [Candidatus Binataceae bacterium]|nr:hypothetical protein [Candidatus Binataceae bacterium]
MRPKFRSGLHIHWAIIFVAILISLVACASAHAEAAKIRQFASADVLAHAEGVGSLPAVILRDGTVCEPERTNPSLCKVLGKLPLSAAKLATDGRDIYFADRQLYSQHFIGTFDGLFDLLNDSKPQVFIDYWPDGNDPSCLPPHNEPSNGPGENPCDAIALLIYRYSSEGYRRYLTLDAPTQGYSSGAWFLNESPRKVILQTRCGGSSGNCLFYLDLKKGALVQITDDYDGSDPTFEDIDHGSDAEIFFPARGYDRTATQGAVLLKWSGNGYRVWWPDWNAPPYAIYVQTAAVGGDKFKEIVAVLDTGADVEEGSLARALGIWRLIGGTWQVVAKAELPSPESITYPHLRKVTKESAGARIELSYGDGSSFTCRYANRKLTCPTALHPAK